MNTNSQPHASVQAGTSPNPWAWIPSLYFAEGLPYVIVMTVSVIMYKRLGISNSDIALYTSLLYLPWAIKPLWSPVVDLFKTKRWWTTRMQALLAFGFLGVALSLPTASFFVISLGFLWVLAISSATHDIAADGFYMLALRDDQQAFFVGIRSTFYRLAMMSGEGFFVIIAGTMEVATGDVPLAWGAVFGGLAVLMAAIAIYHQLMLPKPAEDRAGAEVKQSVWEAFMETFTSFFTKFPLKETIIMFLFLLLYRFGEGQLVKLASPFLLDARELGGLGLSTTQVGVINGTVGIIALVIGGILGGIAVSRQGLKFWLWWMLIAMNLPNAVYVFLAYVQPESLSLIGGAIAIEKFGYGFGFTAYMLYMIYIARGAFKTAHYAFATAIMAWGMMIPGAVSGWIQEQLGYAHFFVWVLVATVPAFVVTAFLKIDPNFGKKSTT